MSATKKRKKQFYMNKNLENAKKFKNNALEAGMKGFLVTCNNMQRKDIVRDTCALLNHHADKMYGPEQAPPTTDDADVCEDIEAAIKKEVKEAKEQRKMTRRFQIAETGYNNFLFFTTTLSDPVALTDAIFEDLLATKAAKSRYVMKLYPVVGSCKMDVKKLRELVMDVIEVYLKGVSMLSYRVELNIRANSAVTKNMVLPVVTTAFTEMKPLASVKLVNPDYVILVNVIKHVAVVSLLKRFADFKKYNVQEMTAVKGAVKPVKNKTEAVEPVAAKSNDAQSDDRDDTDDDDDDAEDEGRGSEAAAVS